LLTYAGFFWLAVLYGRDRVRARASLWLLGIVGALYAAYGLFAYLTGLGETLWLHEMPWAGVGVSSVFVNRNMYVDYAAFGFLAVLGLVLDAWLSHSNSKDEGIAFWQRLLGGKNSYLLLLLVLGLTILAAITLTGSRGGVLAAAIASLALYFLLVRGKGSKPGASRQKIAIGLVVLGAWLIVYLVAGAELGSRFAESGPNVWGGRVAGYELILRAIGEAPLTGYGAGTSYDVFYLFNDGTLWRALNYAHNIYLGAAVELGIPAAILLFAAVGLVVLSCYRGAHRRQRDQVFPALGVAVSLHVAVHGLVDSPLYLAANAATFSFLLGVAYAQSWPSPRH
jgi:O-antigen ligase